MTVQEHLLAFYKANGVPDQGGADLNHFHFKIAGITLRLPNPEFRKKAVHLHDIEHVVFDCDTSWRGEAFIAGIEVGTQVWKHFPVCLLSFWAMGYSLWLYPKEVWHGFKVGSQSQGLFDLPQSQETLMGMDLQALKTMLRQSNRRSTALGIALRFAAWVAVCQIVLSFPLLVLALIWWLVA